MSTAVVYVHGLWMTGLEGVLLRRRLASELKAATPMFAYRSIRASIDANAQALAKRLSRIATDNLHLVGHSLGGLVICKMFEEISDPILPPGRVVFLGSPVAGSRAAHNLGRWKIGSVIMGRSVREELLVKRDRQWSQRRDLGVIAGTLNVGLGRFVNTFQGSGDGTIYVDETRIPGVKEHLAMRVSHSGLLFSPAVAARVASFLRGGSFSSGAAQEG